MSKGTPKTQSYHISKVNGHDIYVDPANGRFYFTLKADNHERVEFNTLRGAEDAARGDKPPIKVISVGHRNYSYPEVVEVIGMSGYNLVTKDYKRLSIYRVWAYDEALFQKLWDAAEECARAINKWQWAVSDLDAVKQLDLDREDNIRTVDGEHKPGGN